MPLDYDFARFSDFLKNLHLKPKKQTPYTSSSKRKERYYRLQI